MIGVIKTLIICATVIAVVIIAYKAEQKDK